MPVVIVIAVLMLLFLGYLITFQPSAKQVVSGLHFLISALACLAIAYFLIPLLGLDINAVIRLISPILIVSGLYQLFDPTPSRKPNHQNQKKPPIQSNPRSDPEKPRIIKEETEKISKAELQLSTTKTLSNATHEWIDYDRGRKDSNFLFNYHLAGAVGCDGNKCVFLALNKSGYRSNCLK